MDGVVHFPAYRSQKLVGLHAAALLSMVLWVEEETGIDVAVVKRHLFQYFRVDRIEDMQDRQFTDAVYFLLLMGESHGAAFKSFSTVQ